MFRSTVIFLLGFLFLGMIFSESAWDQTPTPTPVPTATPTPAATATPVAAPAPAMPGSVALILYDGHGGDLSGKFGYLYAIMLRSLLGHFDMTADLVAIETYTAGKLEAYPVTFYFGSYYDNPVPAAFMTDVMSTSKRIVWFKDNIWQLAWSTTAGFTAKFGLTFGSLRSMDATPSATNPTPGFFDTVLYKNKSLVKYYNYDVAKNIINADPDIGFFLISNPALASTYAQIKNSKTLEIAPYIIHANNFWYVADIPFTYIGPRDRYLVLCDALHDMLGIDHPEQHRALVRLEDVAATVDPTSMTSLIDYMASQQVPFSVATIPFYRDPLGSYNGGVLEEVHLSAATNLLSSLDYAIANGGSIVDHGYTHQYLSQKNDISGVSGDDFEFWDIVLNQPVVQDSAASVLSSLDLASAEFIGSGYSPFAWEPPHYLASPVDYAAFTQRYGTTYQRVAYYTSNTPNLVATDPNRDLMGGLYFPYVINSDYYGQKVIPENLGSMSFDIHTIDPNNAISIPWDTIVGNADAALVVRDGFASFFFHPYWLEAELGLTNALTDFGSLITGIKGLGYTFVQASTLASGIAPVASNKIKGKGSNRLPASMKKPNSKTKNKVPTNKKKNSKKNPPQNNSGGL